MNLLTFIWHTFLNDIPKTYTNMKALFTFIIVCITAISLKAQTDSMKLDSSQNMISDSSEHHTKKNPEMLNDRSLNTPSEKQNSENKPVPAQAPGTEVLYSTQSYQWQQACSAIVDTARQNISGNKSRY
jgi:hypothetical protein